MSKNGGNDLSDFSMLELFRTEVEDRVAVLSEGLLALERDPGATGGIEPLMRAAHSIKGAARIVGLQAAVELAHAMEDCFVAVQEGKLTLRPEHVDTLFKAVDLFQEISKVSESEISSWFSSREEDIGQVMREVAEINKPGVPAPDKEKKTSAQIQVQRKESKLPTQSSQPTTDISDYSMLELFRSELAGHVEVLSNGLATLEQAPESEVEVESLVRAAHSIRGASKIVQLEGVVSLARALEDYLTAYGQEKITPKAEQMKTLVQAVDFLKELGQVSEPEINNWLFSNTGRLENLTHKITRIRKTKGQKAAQAEPKEAHDIIREEPERAGSPEKKPPPEKDTSAKPRFDRITRKEKDSVVRVATERLDNLMGLAGESLIEVRWFRPFSNTLFSLKNESMELYDVIARLGELLKTADLEPHVENYLVEIRQKMSDYVQTFTGRINEFENFARRSASLSRRLHQEVLKSRMRPFADGIQGFPRMIRDMARSLGKKVKYEVSGQQTMVDRDILEKLEAPLNHILRNSLDHGIETPEERKAAGKQEEGTIRIEAAHWAGMLNITITDDGRGIDYDKLRKKIVERKFSSKEMVKNMLENELLEFLFLPGFSTAEKVTEISGRGVGLDVVYSMAHEVGGIIRISSKKGKSMSVNLQLPLTLSVVHTLLVEVSNEPYAFPVSRIAHCLRVHKSEVEYIEGRQYINFEEKNIGLVSSHQVLELETPKPEKEELLVVILGGQVNRYAVVVDRLLGEKELVVQPIDQRLGKIQDISSAASMVDGSPILVFDVEDMAQSIEKILSGDRLRKIGLAEKPAESRKRKSVLVVDDSITVREVERRLLENYGYSVDVAVNGMDGWNAVRSGNYDLVVSDVDMPRMDGIELTKLIKKDPKLKSLLVVIVSYKDREEDKLKGLEAGADHYLTKSSFQDETFIETVKDLIGEA